MTNEHDPADESISELSGKLEGSLHAPDPAAIHAGLQERRGFRRRALTGAAGVFAVVALVGGVFALTGDDDITTTETAADDIDTALVSDEPQDLPTQAVAEDSAPVEVGDLGSAILYVTAIEGDPIENVLSNIADAPTQLRFNRAGIGPYPTDVLEVFGPCRSEAFNIAWDLNKVDTFRILETTRLEGWITAGGYAHCDDAKESGFLFAPGQTLTVTSLSSTQGEFVLQSSGEPAWNVTATLFKPMPSTTTTTETTSTIVVPGLSGLSVSEAQQALLAVGIRSVRLDEQSNNVPVGIVIGTSPPAGALIDAEETIGVIVSAGQRDVAPTTIPFTDPDGPIGFPTTVPPATTSIAPPTTAPPETIAPTPSGPPAFAPTLEPVLSGQWKLVGLWSNGERVGLGTYNGRIPSLSIFGRQLGGNDGCNSQGSGLIYATADGTIQLGSGVSTLVGCQEHVASAAYSSAMSGSQWGFADNDNLIIGSSAALAEFELVEAAPTGSLTGLSGSLNRLWLDDTLHSYDNFNTGEAGVSLTFSASGEPSTATLSIDGCPDHVYEATFTDRSEGSITLSGPVGRRIGCDHSETAGRAIEAVERANYFATAEGGVMLWDDAQQVAVFADEAE